MEVVIASQDTVLRAALRARLTDDRASREPAGAVDGAGGIEAPGAADAADEDRGMGVDEVLIVADTSSELAEALRRQLALRPDPHGDLLVASGPGLSEASELMRFGLEQGVPVLIWPNTGTGLSRASRAQSRLTPREREILALVAGGVSNKGIARALRVSPNTVKFHLAALFHKLAVGTRAEAIAAAARSGELSL